MTLLPFALILLLPTVSAQGLDLPDWLINIVRNMEQIFGVGHQYFNFFWMKQTVTGFCWIISTQYFSEFGYGKVYMRFLCEAQAFVEFDRVWIC